MLDEQVPAAPVVHRTKIFVGRVPETCQQSDLASLFAAYGTVKECDILGNYAFVHMSTPAEAEAAIKALNNYELHGNRIAVEASTSRPKTLPRGGGMPGTGRGFSTRGRFNARGFSNAWDRTRPYPDVYGDQQAYSPYNSSQPGYDAANRYNYYTTNSRADAYSAAATAAAAAAASADPYGTADAYASAYGYDVDYSSAYASDPYGTSAAAAAAWGATAASDYADYAAAAAAASAYSSNSYSTNSYSTAGYGAGAADSTYPTYSTTDNSSLTWSRYANKEPEFCEF